MENLIIIWSGPAWHTAAIYAARANLKPLMFEGFMAGWVAAWWQLTTTTVVENFPWFPDWIDGTMLMMNMRQQSLNAGTRIETKTVDKVDLNQNPFKVFVWNNHSNLSYSETFVNEMRRSVPTKMNLCMCRLWWLITYV